MSKKIEFKARKATFDRWLKCYNRVMKSKVFRNAKEKERYLRFYINNSKQLLEYYPFLDMYTYLVSEGMQSETTGDSIDMNMLTSMPDGWLRTIGFDLCEDLRTALKKDKLLHKAYITELKEKSGILDITVYPGSKRVDDILSKYEDLSSCYCMYCGNPTRFMTKGKISYLCNSCFKKHYLDGRSMEMKDRVYQSCRLTKYDIPVRHKYYRLGNITLKVRFRPIKYKTFKKLWDLKG